MLSFKDFNVVICWIEELLLMFFGIWFKIDCLMKEVVIVFCKFWDILLLIN